MKQFRSTYYAFYALLLLAFVGCTTQMGVFKTDAAKFNDAAGLTLATADGIVTTTRTLLRTQKIGSADAENILKGVELAREGVGIARGVASAQGPVAGAARLRVAADALDAMNLHLQTQGATP